MSKRDFEALSRRLDRAQALLEAAIEAAAARSPGWQLALVNAKRAAQAVLAEVDRLVEKSR